MKYLFLKEYCVDFEEYEQKWTVLETDLSYEQVKKYGRKKRLGEIIMHAEEFTPFVPYETDCFYESDLQREWSFKEEKERIKAMQENFRKKREEERRLIREHNKPYEEKISSINKAIKHELVGLQKRLSKGLEIHRSVVKEEATDELIKAYESEGFENAGIRKGRMHFLHKECQRKINEIYKPKEKEMHAIAEEKIEEIKSKMKEEPENLWDDRNHYYKLSKKVENGITKYYSQLYHGRRDKHLTPVKEISEEEYRYKSSLELTKEKNNL